MENEEKIEVEEVEEIVEVKDDDGNDTTDWKALALKNHGIATRNKTKLLKVKEKLEAKPEIKPEVKPVNEEIKPKVEPEPKVINPLDTVKLVNALKDLDDVEIEQAQMIADYKKITLSEAVKDEGFKLFFDAKREKDKKANLSQTPNGKQGTVDKKDPFFVKFSQGLPKGFDFNNK
jgi:hypothetical protein